jgi:hypothetical protein
MSPDMPLENSLEPAAGWHCSHLYYRFDRARLRTLGPNELGDGCKQFAGKVTQLVTVGVGLDDWEWGVTLWARTPAFLKDIVYRMRFDEASARYAEFGPFYVGYQASPAEILRHCRIGIGGYRSPDD